MGVEGLWKVVKPAASKMPLSEFLLTKAVATQPQNEALFQPLVVGIDASIWMHECQARFFNRHHPDMGENPELRTLFSRLAGLLHLAVIPLFVFDGPHRPDQKRGHKVIKKPHWITERLIEFIEAFGFHWHMAPGEAEAELAALNCGGRIDAVMSDDSEVFIFGAKCVIRSLDDKVSKRKQIYEVYYAEDLRLHPEVSIDTGGFVMFAITRGGDYDCGLPTCGERISHGLAQTNLGSKLVHAVQTKTGHQLDTYIVDWKRELEEVLSDNCDGHLPCRCPSTAAKIPEFYPNLDIVRLYTNPITTNFDADFKRLKVKPLDVQRLVRLCEQSFSWGTAFGIAEKFIKAVWPGVCFRQLLQFESIGSIPSDALIKPEKFHNCTRSRAQSSLKKDENLDGYNIDVDIAVFTSAIQSATTGVRRQLSTFSKTIDSLPINVTVTVPALLVRRYLSHLEIKKPQRSCRQERKSNSQYERAAPVQVDFDGHQIPFKRRFASSSIETAFTTKLTSATTKDETAHIAPGPQHGKVKDLTSRQATLAKTLLSQESVDSTLTSPRTDTISAGSLLEWVDAVVGGDIACSKKPVQSSPDIIDLTTD